jgi:hypothetical protein
MDIKNKKYITFTTPPLISKEMYLIQVQSLLIIMGHPNDVFLSKLGRQ